MKRFLLLILLPFSISIQAQIDSSSIRLDEVLVQSSPLGYEKLGSVVYSFSELGYWKDEEAIGGELATRIKVTNRRSRLKNLKFFVLKNESDSVDVAIKVYRINKNMPGELIDHPPILHRISESRGQVEISLEPYDIVVDDDVVVAVQLIKFYGDKLHFALSATPHGGTAYLREKPENAWDVRWKLGLGFGLLSSYPVSNDIVSRSP